MNYASLKTCILHAENFNLIKLHRSLEDKIIHTNLELHANFGENLSLLMTSLQNVHCILLS